MTEILNRWCWMAAVVSLLLGTSCSRKPAEKEGAAAPPSRYVAANVCASCHAEIAKTYMQTGMGRSFHVATKRAMTVEKPGATYHHKASGRTYRLLEREGRFYLRRHQTGPAGEDENVLEREIHYVMGSGNHARSYLHRTAENRLIELPVSWYAENGGTLAMSPGFDYAFHQDFRRRITHDCMFCHNGYPSGLAQGADLPGKEPFFPTGSLPEGIDCQRCHGPGREHVERASAKAEPAKIREAILNPKRLPPARQMEVCIQCHLETTSFALPNTLQKTGRGIYSYDPQEPLADYALHFDHAKGTGHDDKFEIVSSFYRLRQSSCFLKSAEGKLNCTTCHDPHKALRGEAAVAHYRTVCRNCHSTSHQPASDCTSCHMPKRRTEDVVHAVMTDHKIMRRPPPNPLAPRAEKPASEAYRGEVVLYYPSKEAAGPDLDLLLGSAQVVQDANLKGGIPMLEAAIARRGSDGAVAAGYLFDLGHAYASTGQRDKAIDAYRRTLARDAAHAPALRGLGVALLEKGELTEAVTMLERAAGLDKYDAMARHELARALQQSGRPADAFTALQDAIRADPDFPDAHNTLGQMLLESGNAERAVVEIREAIRLRPDFAQAHSNLANYYTLQKDYARADRHFGIAVELAPKQAVARFNFGLSLAMRGQFDAARQQFELAVKYNPSMAEAHDSLGTLASQRRDWSAAILHYRAALQARPGFDRSLLGIGTALAASGDLIAGRQYLQQAAMSANPQVRGEAMEILQAMPPR